MYKIEAILKSPLMIGGKTLNSNYRESRDYIPGSVLRAAYAKALIQRCACEQKNYWLTFQAQSQCEECAFRAVCQRFSEITFPALYPMGGSPYPVTAREKKYKEKGEKGIFDILKSRLTAQGKAEGESGWKRQEGIYKDGQCVKLIHSAITRTAIDYHRKAAKEGSLYTQNVISEKYFNESDVLSEVVFSGEIRLLPEEEKELDQIRVLHIGADITRGFGICHMSYSEKAEEDTQDKIMERIQEFNLGITGEWQFVILDLLTDAYLGLEEIGSDTLSQTEISDEQMRAFLEEKIGLSNEKYQLCKVYKSQEILRGFDTSKGTADEMRRQGRLVVKAGAVFVYQARANDIDGNVLLELEKNGIGENTKHGFGKIRICDSFHVRYDALKEENRHG